MKAELDVDAWAQTQTLCPKPLTSRGFYAGYDLINLQWYDLGVPEIPLDERFVSFKRRLDGAVMRRAAYADPIKPTA